MLIQSSSVGILFGQNSDVTIKTIQIDYTHHTTKLNGEYPNQIVKHFNKRYFYEFQLNGNEIVNTKLHFFTRKKIIKGDSTVHDSNKIKNKKTISVNKDKIQEILALIEFDEKSLDNCHHSSSVTEKDITIFYTVEFITSENDSITLCQLNKYQKSCEQNIIKTNYSENLIDVFSSLIFILTNKKIEVKKELKNCN